jgi:hypothetical protein
MSEHKRREAIRKAVDEVTRRLTAEGRLVEAGFGAMMILLYPEGLLDDARIVELRDAFMVGAQHLFGSIIGSLLDEDAEPTAADMDRMAKIDAELDQFVRDYARRHGFPPPPPRRPQ